MPFIEICKRIGMSSPLEDTLAQTKMFEIAKRMINARISVY